MWIESHQSIKDHPKTLMLASTLSINLPQAVGHLHFLWHWALDYSDEGNISKYPNAVIARACLWDGSPDEFMDALRECRWVDEDGMIHNWWQYAGRILRLRAENRDRAKAAYAQTTHRKKKSTRSLRIVSEATDLDLDLPTNHNQQTKTNRKRSTEVTNEFKEKMVADYEQKSISREQVLEWIEDALNHKASDKYKDQQRYVQGWLKRNYEWRNQNNGTGRVRPDRPVRGLAATSEFAEGVRAEYNPKHAKA